MKKLTNKEYEALVAIRDCIARKLSEEPVGVSTKQLDKGIEVLDYILEITK